MKIILQVRNVAESTRIVSRALVKSESLSMVGLIEFVVDTGSPITLISLKDRERLRISKIKMNSINVKKNLITIGGGTVNSKIISDVIIKMGEFSSQMPIQIVDDSNGISSNTSVLGVDFLLKNKLKLVFDPTNNKAFFESVD